MLNKKVNFEWFVLEFDFLFFKLQIFPIWIYVPGLPGQRAPKAHEQLKRVINTYRDLKLK